MQASEGRALRKDDLRRWDGGVMVCDRSSVCGVTAPSPVL